jgi:hypothetical protein
MELLRKARVKAHFRHTKTGVAPVMEHERKIPVQLGLFDAPTIAAVQTINEPVISAKTESEKEYDDYMDGADMQELLDQIGNYNEGIDRLERELQEPYLNPEEIDELESDLIRTEMARDKLQERLDTMKPVKTSEVIAAVIEAAKPETRIQAQEALFGKPEPEESVKQEEKAYRFEPEIKKNVKTGVFEETAILEDWSSVDLKKIGTVKYKEGQEKPSWMPDIDRKMFHDNANTLVFFDMGNGMYYVECATLKNKYMMSYNFSGQRQSDSMISGRRCAIMPAELAVITETYYRDAERAELNKKYQQKVQDYGTAKKERIKTVGKNKALWDHVYLWERMTGNNRGRQNVNFWSDWRKVCEDKDQKKTDLECQNEENESSYTKGRETSYGKSGTKKILFDKYGVLVKRQNGDEITRDEVNQLDGALQEVYSVFGDKSGMAKKFELVVSHAGEKMQHARKAIGLFNSSYHAIGVSWTGNESAGMTLAHEFAHFMDYWMADKTGRRSGWFASDDWNSDTGQIAKTFRDNMNEKQTSKYQNRTCECFARAFEQYFYWKRSGKVLNGKNYAKAAVFNERLRPMIEKWLSNNSELMKAFIRGL